MKKKHILRVNIAEINTIIWALDRYYSIRESKDERILSIKYKWESKLESRLELKNTPGKKTSITIDNEDEIYIIMNVLYASHNVTCPSLHYIPYERYNVNSGKTNCIDTEHFCVFSHDNEDLGYQACPYIIGKRLKDRIRALYLYWFKEDTK